MRDLYTAVKDEPRRSFRFATAKATETFYVAYRAPYEENRSIDVGIGLPYRQRTVESDNIRFNAAASRADTNQDGLITEKEASRFSESAKQKSSHAPPPGF